MSTSVVGEAAHFGRRASAFFGRTSVFMSALSIGDAACFGRVSAFFGRASVFMPALGRAFVLGFRLGALPVDFVGLAANEVLEPLHHVEVLEPLHLVAVAWLFMPALGRAFVLVLGARPVAFVGPAAAETLVGVCVAVALLWLTVRLP